MEHSPRPPTGNYPLELRPGEINRLRIQSEALKFDAKTMLDKIGVAKGWHCLDLGCGAGGIMDLLSTSEHFVTMFCPNCSLDLYPPDFCEILC